MTVFLEIFHWSKNTLKYFMYEINILCRWPIADIAIIFNLTLILIDLRFSASTICLWLWLISFASVVTYEQVETCDNLNSQIIKVLMFLIW